MLNYYNPRFPSYKLKVTNESSTTINETNPNGFRDIHHQFDAGDHFTLWQTAKGVDLLPLVIIHALYMLIGVVGNSTVCYVSAIRMPRTVLNCFVLSLAIAELFGCIIIIPIEITKTMNTYSFDYPVLCKTEKYLRSFVIFFTNCILIAIATERYQRIVKPHNRHVTMFQFRLTVISSIIFAAVAAVPEAVLAGNQSIQSRYGKGIVCSTYCSDTYTGTVFPPLWACFVVLVYVVSTAAIGSIYCVIAITIWKRGKLQTDRRSRSNTPDLAFRRQVQCSPSINQPSILYLPHHSSLPSPVEQRKTEFSYASLDRYELRSRQVFKQKNDFNHLSARASSTDDLEIKVEVHLSGRPNNGLQRKSDGHDGTSIRSPFYAVKTHAPRHSLEDRYNIYDQDDHRPDSNGEDQTRHEEKDSDDSSDILPREDVSILNSISEANRSHNYSHTHFGEVEQANLPRHSHHPYQQHRQSQSHQTRKGRRFTAVFFDELYQTVSRRRQRQEEEFLERHMSTEDILTPPGLTPVGSIRSRSGYSRKRTTFIMFVMTATTAISLLPHTVVLLYHLAQPSLEMSLSSDETILFYLAWNSFFISLACHPYVYGFWNGRFKKALVSLFGGFREKTTKKRLSNREEENKDSSSARN